MAKRKNNPDQPELPIHGAGAADLENIKMGPEPKGNGEAAKSAGEKTASSPRPSPPEEERERTSQTKSRPGKSRNGETHVLAEEVVLPVPHLFVPGKIELPFHRRVDRSFLDYASYVIRDRAIPNLADGLKPVQRRIMWALQEKDDGRFIKVNTVAGHAMQYHPHGNA